MASLVLTTDFISVNLESEHLEVVKRGEEPQTHERIRLNIPLYDVDRVIICGRPNISIPVLQRLMKNGIPAFFITSKGRWIGSLLPDNNLNAMRRIRQYELARDEKFALRVAKKLVYAKIKNSRRVLQRLAANRFSSEHKDQQNAVNLLEQFAQKVLEAQNLEQLRGYEGVASATYFERLSAFFPEDIPFRGRNKQPPKDEANALLSWTYTILLAEVDGAVRAQGLDACIGCLHELSHGRASLSLDLLEPLRAPVCDIFVLHLFNHKIFKKDDFEFSLEDGGVYMKQESREKYFTDYEQMMTRKFTPANGGPHLDFRQVITQQVLNFLKALEGKEDFEFFKMP